eukprot:SAG31_NODE_914_length_11058_cov_13.316270_3_plen_89_part_00
MVLDSCTIDDTVQAAGTSFCVQGEPCSSVQHAAMAQCMASCDSCHRDATLVVLGDCVADTDVVFGGTWARPTVLATALPVTSGRLGLC